MTRLGWWRHGRIFWCKRVHCSTFEKERLPVRIGVQTANVPVRERFEDALKSTTLYHRSYDTAECRADRSRIGHIYVYDLDSLRAIADRTPAKKKKKSRRAIA